MKVIKYPTFMLQVRNSFDGLIVFDKEGIPLSIKKEHGWGTRSIATFCEKNNGLCEFGAEGEMFYLRVVLQ